MRAPWTQRGQTNCRDNDDDAGLPVCQSCRSAGYDLNINLLDWRQLRDEHQADPMSAPSWLFGALEEKFGLKMELRSERVEVWVIDRLEKPSAN